MDTLNEANVGSSGNTQLIGSSPVVGTTLQFLTDRDTACQAALQPSFARNNFPPLETASPRENRIHKAFAIKKFKPHTFFIGAAIETKMAGEIWDMLTLGILENAATLTDEGHIASITSLVCAL